MCDKTAESKTAYQLASMPLSSFEKLTFVLGLVMLMILLPLTATTVAATVLWDALDRGFMGKPQDGIVMQLARFVNRQTKWFGEYFVRNKEDAFQVNTCILLGIIIPGIFFYLLNDTLNNGFNPYLCFAYHVFRLGPYFMNFASCYVGCHKECHSHFGIFKAPYNIFMNNVFNWWIGLFFGVLPSTFAYGHTINHHKYNNGPQDVVTTSDKPRDSAVNFVCYLPRWLAYATNFSTVLQFWADNEKRTAISMNIGTIYYGLWVYFFYQLSPQFAIWYVMFPLGENVLLLACINWCWHAFLNPLDPEDDYIGSVTILEGPINVQGEDYHVIHHKYPGAHWTEHEGLYKRDLAAGEYHKGPASMFRGTHAFELFFLIILRQYEEIGKRMFDIRGKWTEEEKIEVIKTRLRTCWWGPRRNLDITLQGKEIRKQK